jgi:hypothetical protein
LSKENSADQSSRAKVSSHAYVSFKIAPSQLIIPELGDKDFPDVISTPSPIVHPKYKLKQVYEKLVMEKFDEDGSIKSAGSFMLDDVKEGPKIAKLPTRQQSFGQGLMRTRQQQYKDLTGTDLADKAVEGSVKSQKFDFNEMESCKISGMSSSFKSYKKERQDNLLFLRQNQYNEFEDESEKAEEKPMEFTQVESEEFWEKIGYDPGELRELQGPLKIQNEDLIPRLEQFLKDDNA